MNRDPRHYQRIRRFKYGSNALILTISVIGLLVIAYVVLARQSWRYDLTANHDFTLAPQTNELLENLRQPVTIRAFFRSGGDMDQVFIRRKVDDILQEYAARSKYIDYKMIDPDVDFEQTLAYGIQMDGTIVFQSDERRKDIYQAVLFEYTSLAESSVPLFVGEALFTNAIFNVTEGHLFQVCFMGGHGERLFTSPDTEGLKRIGDLLKTENYHVESVSMAEQTLWSQRCDVLVVAGAKRGFHSREDQALLSYLQSGGKIILMVDPQSAIGLDKTLQYLGVSFHRGVVFDPEKHFILGPHYPAPVLSDHVITEPLKSQGLQPVFYLARPIIVENEHPRTKIEPLLMTSPVAWGETRLKVQDKPTPDPDVDLKGPITLGVAVSDQTGSESAEQGALPKEEQGRAVVIGDSNFITNSLIEIPGNQDLMMNSIAWLLGQREQIAVRPQKPDFRPLVIGQNSARLITVSTQMVYPGLILSLGLFYWWRRKKR